MTDPKRKTIRLQDYDYSSNGAYFVTVCTQNRTRYFWINDEPHLTEQEKVIVFWTKELSRRFSGVYLDSYAMMPNHVHLILFLEDSKAIWQKFGNMCLKTR